MAVVRIKHVQRHKVLWVVPGTKCPLSNSKKHKGKEEEGGEKEGGRGRRGESPSLGPSGSRNQERVSGCFHQHHPLGQTLQPVVCTVVAAHEVGAVGSGVPLWSNSAEGWGWGANLELCHVSQRSGRVPLWVAFNQ